jgi:protein TonB
MKLGHYLAAVGVVSLFAPALAAQQARAPVVVTAKSPAVDGWSARMANALKHHLRYPDQRTQPQPHEGVVSVHFRCSDSGKPSAVALAHSSGHGDLDRAALRAVRNIRTMHPLPEGITHDQNFRAVVLFAKNRQGYDRQMAQLRDDAARQNASLGGGAPLAMTIGLVSAS